jgi:hypothetical protein
LKKFEKRILLASCVWIKGNKDGRKGLDTLVCEGQKEKSIQKKGRKNGSYTKQFKS